MGRRKKEPRSAHREKISAAAAVLFAEKGVEATSMDDIAKAAGYSKATLYVYFENKDEIIGILALRSMQKLYGYICDATERQASVRERYELICRGLVRYYEEFPFYFSMALLKINTNFEKADYIPEEKETYLVGEQINEKLKSFLMSGIESGDFKKDLDIMPAIFNLWGMLSGVIQLASSKEEYIQSAVGMTKTGFLEYGFDMLYRSVENAEGEK